MKYSKLFIISVLLVCFSAASYAQELTYNQFIKLVAEKNAAYLAEKYNVDIATANVQAAKVFNDPELSVGYGNNEDWSLQMGQSVEVELSYNINFGGVRRARINAANSEKEVTEASVNAYLCNLRSEAGQAWAEAWRLRESCKVLEANVIDMEKIAQGDSIRLSVGDLGRTDAMQSKLEAQTLRHELIALEAEYMNALLNLSYLIGGEKVEGIADQGLPTSSNTYTEPGIYQTAEANRADLRAAELSQVLSENNMKLVKASRAMELGLSLGYSWNKEVRNEIAPAPKFNGFSIGFSVPLKFSNSNKGELNAARQAIMQSQQALLSARQQVHMEVAQAFNNYKTSKKVMEQYNGSILQDAKEILESRKIGYQSGENSLIEVITAQQSYQEVMQAYIDAASQCYVSEIQLIQAIGL